MMPSLLFRAGAAAFATALTACGPSVDPPSACEAELLAGDLVITEVMANPAGEDAGQEYIEFYNASGAALALGGVTLVVARADGSQESQHLLVDLAVEPGQYAVVGDVLPEFKPDYVDYGYAAELGSLANGGGQVALRCGELLIDSATYGEAPDGASLGLDGSVAPDALVNDNPATFCAATTEFAPGALGSPGSQNGPCSAVSQDSCLEGGAERAVVRPKEGELVITEVMPNPAAVDDSLGEWFEITALAAVDLNGLVAGQDPSAPKLRLAAPECLSLAPGDVALFARSADTAKNGLLPPLASTFSFGLTNSGGALFIGGPETVIDSVTWPAAAAGASLALDPAKTSAEANDDPASWCDGRDVYGDGDRGSPGADNPPCDASGICEEGGVLRPLVAPVAGDLRIAEIMANPVVVGDADGEWFELEISADVDLNGLQVGRGSDATAPEFEVSAAECVRAAAGSHVVFARNLDPATNGGIDPAEGFLIFDADIPLAQQGGVDYPLFVGLGGEVLATASYSGSEISAGASLILEESGARCEATVPYNQPSATGAGPDLGSPGAANELCP